MKSIIKLSLVASVLVVGLNASQGSVDNEEYAFIPKDGSTVNGYVNAYGINEVVTNNPNDNSDNKTYRGAGLDAYVFYKDTTAINLTVEGGSDFSLVAGTVMQKIVNGFYGKVTASKLVTEASIEGNVQDITADNFGAALGVGNDWINVEWGYFTSNLTDAGLASDRANTVYGELVTIYKYNVFGFRSAIDFVGVARSTDVYNKKYSSSSAEIGLYLGEDTRAFCRNDSIKGTDNEAIRFGLNIPFSGFDLDYPNFYLDASKTDGYNTCTVQYTADIIDKPLNTRDELERISKARDTIHQRVAGDEFYKRTAVQTVDSGSNTPADTEAPALTTTTGSVTDTGTPGTETVSYAGIVSDNITSNTNLTVVVTTPNAEVTVTNLGDSVTFVRNSGVVSTEVVGFVFEDESGKQSAEFTQTILGLDTI